MIIAAILYIILGIITLALTIYREIKVSGYYEYSNDGFAFGVIIFWPFFLFLQLVEFLSDLCIGLEEKIGNYIEKVIKEQEARYEGHLY